MSDLYATVKRQEMRISELEDIIAKMKRIYDDILENLDESNFSSEMIKEKDDMKASLTVAADKIESVVEKVDGNTANISKIEQTAEKIQSTVARYSGDTEELKTQITQTAEKIESVAEDVSGSNERISEIEQTAEKIESTVTNRFGDVVVLDSEDDEKSDRSKVYFYNGTYYYYNALSEEWEETEDEFVKSTFTQTKDGFRLEGDVEINGNTYVGGNIYGSTIYDAGERGKLVLGYEDEGTPLSDLTYYRVSDGKNLFRVFDGIDNVSVWLNGVQIGYVGSYETGDFYPEGKWNFSSAEVTGLSTVAVFG